MNLAPPSPAVFLLLAFFSLALAILVLFKARSGPVRNYFSLFAVSNAVWLGSGFLLYSDIDPQRGLLWARIAFAAGALLILSLYHVLMLFPDEASLPFGRSINCVGGVLALLSLFSPLLARDVTTTGVFRINVLYGPLFLPFTAYALTILIVGMYVLVRRFRGASGLRRLQIQYLLLGTAVPVAGVFVVNLILPLVFKVTALAPYGRLLALVFLPVTAHAIIRHRLMDIKLFVQKAVVYVCAMAVGAAFFGGLLWLVAFLNPGASGGVGLEAVVLAIGIAAILQPVKGWIERALNQYLYRERHDYPRILKESSQRLSTFLNVASMADYLTGLVSEMFKAEWVQAYVRDQSRDVFVPLAHRGQDGGPGTEAAVPTASPIPLYLDWDRRLLIRDEFRNDERDASHVAAIAALRNLSGELVIAFWHVGGLWGFLIIGTKLSGDPYFSEDIDFLVTLGSQAAVAIENVQLHHQMEEERLRAERLGVIETLASGIAHEIKNPLVAIRTFAELLPERFQDEDFHTGFSKIVLKEIERIDGLVARLRELATRPTQQLGTLDLRGPIDETLTLLRGQLEQKQIRAHIEWQTDMPLISGAPNLLKQLFLNLFLNAIDATEPGGELRIHGATRETSGSSRLMVEVTDSGTGIPPQMVNQIFDPFVSSKPGGSGLGLAICRSIADAHRARISARNNADRKGATFTVEFPLGDLAPLQALDGLEGLNQAQAAPTNRVS
jgi:signal transduction histidine kinase